MLYRIGLAFGAAAGIVAPCDAGISACPSQQCACLQRPRLVALTCNMAGISLHRS